VGKTLTISPTRPQLVGYEDLVKMLAYLINWACIVLVIVIASSSRHVLLLHFGWVKRRALERMLHAPVHLIVTCLTLVLLLLLLVLVVVVHF